MDHFKYKTYTKQRVQFLHSYKANVIAYLRRKYPTVPIDKIKNFVQKQIDMNLRRPNMKLIVYPSYGNAKVTDVDLLSYTENFFDNIITPAGVLYKKPSVQESFLKKKINKNLKFRKVQKKRMLEAAAVGDLITEQVANYLQASIKIETNSIPGAYGSAFNCLFDIPGYNAVTATARHNIMSGYAHVEKLLAGNFYFPDLDHMINYCIQMCRVCPKDIMDVVKTYNLYIPTVGDLATHFKASMVNYMNVTIEIWGKINNALSSFSDSERTFIYYGGCLKTLFGKNETLFKPYLNNFFSTDVPIEQVNPKDIYKTNPDLLAMATSLNSNLIEGLPVAEAVDANHEGIQKIIGISKHMERSLDDLSDIWQTFLRIDCDVPDAMSHPNMIRKAVIISDTDSVFFTTQHWIQWFLGKISFDRKAYEINAFIVFLVVMTLEQLFARLSTSIGAEGDDIYRISMKNEFMYPLMLRTPVPKQYAGRVLIQEGFVLPKPKNDIKGLAYRSSSFCKETQDAGIEFVNWIMDEVMKHGTIKASDCIQKALAHERRVSSSILEGKKTFLTTSPIKNIEDYKNDTGNNYYYWEFWDQVFKPNFGEFILPGKGYELPLLADGKILRDPLYLSRLEAYDKKLHDRLLKFLDQNKRPITRIYIPMTLKKIPEILRPVLDIRGMVYSNSTPFVITLRSLGLGFTDSSNQTLLSDIYG